MNAETRWRRTAFSLDVDMSNHATFPRVRGSGQLRRSSKLAELRGTVTAGRHLLCTCMIRRSCNFLGASWNMIRKDDFPLSRGLTLTIIRHACRVKFSCALLANLAASTCFCYLDDSLAAPEPQSECRDVRSSRTASTRLCATEMSWRMTINCEYCDLTSYSTHSLTQAVGCTV